MKNKKTSRGQPSNEKFEPAYIEEEEIATTQDLAADPLPFTSFTLSVLPETTLAHPYEISLPKGSHPMLFPINAPLVGLAQDPDPITRPLRNALLTARAWGFPVVLLTGNILHLDVTRAGKLQGFRAFASDARDDGNLFEGMETRIKHRIKALREHFINGHGDPIFKGPILATFGRSEDEIINFWVNERVNRTVAIERQRIETDKRMLTSRIKELDRHIIATRRILDHQEKEQTFPDEEIERLRAEITENESEIEKTRPKVDRLTEEKTLARASNISEAMKKQWFLEAQKRLITLFEENIPWLKVIATRNCFLKIGSYIVKLVQNPRETVAETYAAQVQNDTRLDLKTGRRVPDCILIAGANVTGAYFRVNYPKSEDDPNEIASVHVVELPMCINSFFLQRLADLSVRVGPFLTRLVSTKFFTGGVVPCGWVSNFFVSDIWWDKHLAPQSPEHTGATSRAYQMFTDPRLLEKYAQSKFMFYGELEGDMQEGAKQQAYYAVPEIPFRFAPYEYHHDFFLKHEFPIHYYVNLGDVVQGENHEYHREVPEEYLNPHAAKKAVRDILLSDMYVEEKAKALGKMVVLNSWLIGVQRVDDQLSQYIDQAYGSHPWGSAYFAKVLRNAKKIGLNFAENAGLITIIGGNHIGNTPGVGEHFNEALVCADRLRDILMSRHRFNRDEVFAHVRAPMGSAKTITRALGAFGILLGQDLKKDSSALSRDKLPYCLSAKHKPGRGGARHSIAVKQMRGVRTRLGTTMPTFKDRFVLEVAGHIDRDQWCMVPNGLISISPGQEFQGPYAEEEDFSLADMGTKVIGFPHDGLEPFGPLIHISFNYEVLYQYIKAPWQIDVEALFPNSL